MVSRPERDPFATQRAHRALRREPIMLSPDRQIVVQLCVDALAMLPGVYQRGSTLVEVWYDRESRESRTDHVKAARLRELLHAASGFTKQSGSGAVRPVVLERDVLEMVDARADYAPVPRVSLIARTPVLTGDGALHAAPGFYAAHRLVVAPDAVYPEVKWPPTLRDARRAAVQLLDLVRDFPFAAGVDQSAWLAALLTPLARSMYQGDAPLFVVEADIGGRGKTLLIDVISEIVSGAGAYRSALSFSDEEMRKRITSLALGDTPPITLLDNVDTRGGDEASARLLGPAALNAALTSGGRWSDRVLGTSKSVTLPLTTTFFATGNNVLFHSDTARRTCVISLGEPRRLGGFKYPELREHVRRNRPQLLMAALTVLGAYVAARKPHIQLAPIPSFEEWNLVRAAVVWASRLPDPAQCFYLATTRLHRGNERRERAMACLLGWIERVFSDGNRRTAGQWLNRDVAAVATPPERSELDDALRVLLCIGVGQQVSVAEVSKLLATMSGQRLASGEFVATPRRSASGQTFVLVP